MFKVAIKTLLTLIPYFYTLQLINPIINLFELEKSVTLYQNQIHGKKYIT